MAAPKAAALPLGDSPMFEITASEWGICDGPELAEGPLACPP